MKRHACLALALVGCGSTAVTPAPSVEPAPMEVAAVAPPELTVLTEDQARAAAESFVRAQGYTDALPTVIGDQIVHEGIEGSMEDRRHTLEPHVFSVSPAVGGWRAVFRYQAYQHRQYAERGRLLVHDAEGTHFIHQDMLLDPRPVEPTP